MHNLSYTNKEAQEELDLGLIEVDGAKIFANILLDDRSEIRIRGSVVRPRQNFIYLKFNKPAGYQSSLNIMVENNLSHFFRDYKNLSIAGRLDKMSEGLLILSNDGKWVEKISNPKFEKEKEYEVTLDKAADQHFFTAFKKGVAIGNYITKPCECELLKENQIRVVLKEGKNRQIRRMCATLGYRVIGLKRIRISMVSLGQVLPGEHELIPNNKISII